MGKKDKAPRVPPERLTQLGAIMFTPRALRGHYNPWLQAAQFALLIGITWAAYRNAAPAVRWQLALSVLFAVAMVGWLAESEARWIERRWEQRRVAELLAIGGRAAPAPVVGPLSAMPAGYVLAVEQATSQVLHVAAVPAGAESVDLARWLIVVSWRAERGVNLSVDYTDWAALAEAGPVLAELARMPDDEQGLDGGRLAEVRRRLFQLGGQDLTAAGGAELEQDRP